MCWYGVVRSQGSRLEYDYMTRASLLRRDNLPPWFRFPIVVLHPSNTIIVSFPDSSMNCGLWSNRRSVEINVGNVLRSKTRRGSVSTSPSPSCSQMDHRLHSLSSHCHRSESSLSFPSSRWALCLFLLPARVRG